MPSGIIQKENEVNFETKEIIENIESKVDIKKNGSDDTKIDDEEQVDNKLEVSNRSEELGENENKENEEPLVEDTETLKKRAAELLFEGKRHLIIKDFQSAADVLSEACSLFGTIYGEMAEECAEAYFKYGCALLELSKDQISPVGLEEKDDEENEEVSIQEDSVIENDINNEESNITDIVIESDKNNKENKVDGVNKTDKNTENINTDIVIKTDMNNEEDKVDNEIESDKIEENLVKNVEKEISADKEKSDDVEEDSTENEEKLGKESSASDEEKPGEENIEEDEINDLQLAWEMLDLAKVIYKTKDTEDSKLKLSEVLMKCGEVSFEDEKFETAIEDITEALEIQRLLLPEDSRIIAETLFQLGVAQELGGSSEQATKLLTEAVAVLEHRIKNLESLTDDKTKEEIIEIKTIIPEIKEKIIDIKERKQAAVFALMAAVGARKEAATDTEESTIKPASNISHLVRKRPKQEQEETNGTIPSKVPKLEESTIDKQ